MKAIFVDHTQIERGFLDLILVHEQTSLDSMRGQLPIWYLHQFSIRIALPHPQKFTLAARGPGGAS